MLIENDEIPTVEPKRIVIDFKKAIINAIKKKCQNQRYRFAIFILASQCGVMSMSMWRKNQQLTRKLAQAVCFRNPQPPRRQQAIKQI